MFKKTVLLAGFAVAGLSACTQPQPVPVGPEPISDKYGALHCPAGYVLQGASCVLPEYATTDSAMDGTSDGTDPSPGTDTGGNQNRNQNQEENTNRNQEENTNQNQSTSG